RGGGRKTLFRSAVCLSEARPCARRPRAGAGEAGQDDARGGDSLACHEKLQRTAHQPLTYFLGGVGGRYHLNPSFLMSASCSPLPSWHACSHDSAAYGTRTAFPPPPPPPPPPAPWRRCLAVSVNGCVNVSGSSIVAW